MKNRRHQKFIKILFVVVFLLALFVGLFKDKLYGKESSKKVSSNKSHYPTIVIDAGHGGFDGGASVGDIMEKDINLQIAKKLEQLFVSNGFHVIMIRENDDSVADKNDEIKATKKKTDMDYRLDTMHENENTIFISIHQNKFASDSSCKGTQVFFSKNIESSQTLATGVQESVRALLQPENHRKVVGGGRNLFLLYKAQVPAILVECGFMSNPLELSSLKNEEYQREMAFAIYCGVVSQMENV